MGQRGAAEVRHAHRLHRAGLVDGVDRHDVGVPQPGELLRLVGRDGRHLQDDEPVGQGFLLGQEHPGERPAADLLDEVEVEEPLAGGGEQGVGRVGLAARFGLRNDRPVESGRRDVLRGGVEPEGLAGVAGLGLDTVHDTPQSGDSGRGCAVGSRRARELALQNDCGTKGRVGNCRAAGCPVEGRRRL